MNNVLEQSQFVIWILQLRAPKPLLQENQQYVWHVQVILHVVPYHHVVQDVLEDVPKEHADQGAVILMDLVLKIMEELTMYFESKNNN